jgi:nitroreductase
MKDILERRSIRKYTDEPVSDQDRENLLKAAMAAPSAGNQQPWEFIVIDDRDALNTMKGFHEKGGYHMLGHAPLAIVVCGDLKKQLHKGYWVLDCTAATENILLAAQSLGLGAVWLGVYPREERIARIKELLGLPENIMPLSLISIGHPAETKKPSDRYNKALIHQNRW